MRRAKLAISLAFASLFAACYDWAVRSGATVENPKDDAGNDDAEADVSFVDAGEDSGPTDAALSCDALAAELADAMRHAQECTFNSPTDCAASVKDECGCIRWLKVADAAASRAYATSRQRFVAADCKSPCIFCLTPGTKGNCIFSPSDTVQAHCSP